MKKCNLKNRAMRMLATAMFMMLPAVTFAQEAMGEVQTALRSWGQPLFYGAAILVIFVGAAVNMEKIIDKEGTGTRQQGIQNVAVIVLFVLVVVAAISFASSRLQSMTF